MLGNVLKPYGLAWKPYIPCLLISEAIIGIVSLVSQWWVQNVTGVTGVICVTGVIGVTS